jgi:hypothetical protein
MNQIKKLRKQFFYFSATITIMLTRKQAIIFFIGCSILGIVLGVIIAQKNGVVFPTPQQITQKIIPSEPKPVHIIFAGDLMLDRGVEQSVINNMDGDFNKLFDDK